MAKKEISINYKAEYEVIGTDNPSNLVIVFHGYGQLARFFIRKFESLSDSCKVVAPQGLSRFYLEGFYGKVGATWMTKEERETDIENYVNYISGVCKAELSSLPSDINVHLIGFSQGAATATRFFMNTDIPISSLTLWAGIFPPDLNFPEAQNRFKDIPVSIMLGTSDPYINEDRKLEMNELIEKIGIQPEIIWYEGDHSIIPASLESLKKKLNL